MAAGATGISAEGIGRVSRDVVRRMVRGTVRAVTVGAVAFVMTRKASFGAGDMTVLAKEVRGMIERSKWENSMLAGVCALERQRREQRGGVGGDATGVTRQTALLVVTRPTTVRSERERRAVLPLPRW